MLTEFHGDAVTGGSYPALIWKSFAEKALKSVEPQSFPSRSSPTPRRRRSCGAATACFSTTASAARAQEVVYFSGTGPSRKANCLENEVQVPDVRRLSLAEAEARVEAQPLMAELVYKPAAPLQRPGVVVDQQPRKGYRSSYDSIILVVNKATHGVIPDLVGTPLEKALLKVRKQ